MILQIFIKYNTISLMRLTKKEKKIYIFDFLMSSHVANKVTKLAEVIESCFP